MATLQLATWATNLTTLPPSVQKAATRSLYNYIGCAIGGSHHPTTFKATAALSPFFGPPTSTLFGHNNTSSGPPKTDAQHASLLNGIASHVHDYDDTHLQTIIHPTGPIASALLAYTQTLPSPTSGGTLALALTAGIEASCKLGLAVWPSHYDIGWHITSTTGSIGAAVAVGKLMGLSVGEMVHAIGIASSQVIGLRDMFGTDTKSFHPGRAAQAGLMAAVLAQKGYTASESALEAKRGWGNVVIGATGTKPRLEELLGELGSVWEVERNAFKPFPCGIVCHPAIDAAVQVHGELEGTGKKVGDVRKVEARVHALVIELTSKRKPKDGLEAKFSVFHGAAVGLLFGKAGPAEYADEVVTDPAVVRVRDNIDAVADEKIQPDETVLEVTFNDGSTLVKHVQHAVGSLEVPMTDEQLTRKFVDQCALVLGAEQAAKASDAAWSLTGVDAVQDVLAKL